jgi:hypothetical protein
MRWPGGGICLAIALAAGVGNYAVKQMVQGLDDELNNVRRKTVAEQKQIHDLTAEWTYLNQPELLTDLNRRYLGLVAIAPKQERTSVADLPMRRAPPPDPAPPQQIAAAPMPAPAAAPTITKTAPIVPVSVTAPAAATPPTAPERQKPASLDALFAQIAGDR